MACRVSADPGDHPHACGEHEDGKDEPTSYTGSSPRVWGACLCVESRHLRRGIIPTRVGSIALERAVYLRKRDHPHACGEHRRFPCLVCLIEGSSPRVWGASYNLKRYTQSLTGSSPRVWGA